MTTLTATRNARELPPGVVTLLTVCVLLIAVLAAGVVILAVRVTVDDERSAEHHGAFCGILTAELTVERDHAALLPLAPITVAGLASENCT